MNTKIIGVALLLLGFAGGWMWMDYQNALRQPVLVDRMILIEIEKGDSLGRIIDKLVAEKGVIKPFWFRVIALQKKALKKLKTGEYELTPGLTVPKILALFVQGKTKQHAITFPEGWSFKEMRHEIEKNTDLEHTLNGVAFDDVMSKLGIGGKLFAHPHAVSFVLTFDDLNHCFRRDFGYGIIPKTPFIVLHSEAMQSPDCASSPVAKPSPEGLFFPDTYFFEKHTSDVALLKRAYDKMQRVLQQEWLKKAEGLPFKTPYEALILASIVEKETGAAAERPQIAGVFIRRLEQKMLLQTDPTVIYGMGESYQGNIKSKDLTTATPYNTYIISGLPPTPIAMPGRAALHAVLHPAEGDSVYFVARGDGTHVFSATLKDHNSAVDKFQRNKK